MQLYVGQDAQLKNPKVSFDAALHFTLQVAYTASGEELTESGWAIHLQLKHHNNKPPFLALST